MNRMLCALPFVAANLCSAQQWDEFQFLDIIQRSVNAPRHLAAAKPVTPTVSIQEFAHRYPSKAVKLFLNGKKFLEKGNHDAAIESFQRAVRIDPLFTEARSDLALELVATGKTEQGIEELRTVLQHDPSSRLGYTNLGAILCNHRRYAEAEAVARRALAVDPTCAKISLILAVALFGQNKPTVDVEKALKLTWVSYPVESKAIAQWFGFARAERGEPPP